MHAIEILAHDGQRPFVLLCRGNAKAKADSLAFTLKGNANAETYVVAGTYKGNAVANGDSTSIVVFKVRQRIVW